MNFKGTDWQRQQAYLREAHHARQLAEARSAGVRPDVPLLRRLWHAVTGFMRRTGGHPAPPARPDADAAKSTR